MNKGVGRLESKTKIIDLKL